MHDLGWHECNNSTERPSKYEKSSFDVNHVYKNQFYSGDTACLLHVYRKMYVLNIGRKNVSYDYDYSFSYHTYNYLYT